MVPHNDGPMPTYNDEPSDGTLSEASLEASDVSKVSNSAGDSAGDMSDGSASSRIASSRSSSLASSLSDGASDSEDGVSSSRSQASDSFYSDEDSSEWDSQLSDQSADEVPGTTRRHTNRRPQIRQLHMDREEEHQQLRRMTRKRVTVPVDGQVVVSEGETVQWCGGRSGICEALSQFNVWKSCFGWRAIGCTWKGGTDLWDGVGENSTPPPPAFESLVEPRCKRLITWL